MAANENYANFSKPGNIQKEQGGRKSNTTPGGSNAIPSPKGGPSVGASAQQTFRGPSPVQGSSTQQFSPGGSGNAMNRTSNTAVTSQPSKQRRGPGIAKKTGEGKSRAFTPIQLDKSKTVYWK